MTRRPGNSEASWDVENGLSQPDIFNPQVLSFPNMYNTMGSTMDGLAVRDSFLSTNALKTAFWAATFSDHLTSERSNPNFPCV